MKPATETILTRVFITLMSLFTTMAVGHRLGAQGLGEVSLIVLGITVVMLMSSIVGGGALVYFASRTDRYRLLVPSYAWVALTAGVAWILLRSIPVLPPRYITAVVVLATLQGVFTVHLNIVLGWERFRAANAINAVQSAALLLAFLAIEGQGEIHDASDYVTAALVAFGLTVVLSSIAIAQGPRRRRRSTLTVPDQEQVLRRLFQQGGQVQAANALQLVNYRFMYWLLDRLQGTALLGVYSVGTQLAESSWLVPRALGTVLYSKVSNAEGAQRQRDLTIDVLKASMLFAATVLIVLALVPGAWIKALFGSDVRGVPAIVLLLAPGMLAMAASQAFSHFFSGTARNRHNMIGSGLGLVASVIAGLLLVPRLGLRGAAMATSVAHLANASYQCVMFLRISGAQFSDLLPHAGDRAHLRRLWRTVTGR